MTVLRDLSLMWSFIHTLVLFLLLFESRCSTKKTVILTAIAMTPLIAVNFVLILLLGVEEYMKLMLVTLSLPSFIFFLILAKHRDGRFIFTFCMVDTLVLEIIYITNIINSYIPGYIFMFTMRLIVFPLIEFIIYKRFKRVYREIQSEVSTGWSLFAIIGIMFYAVITVSMSYPTSITERPEYLPAFIILLVLMPVSYINIFNTLLHQQRIYMIKEEEDLLRLQVADIKKRVEEYSTANDNFRNERHNFRHKLQTISRMVETKKYDELIAITAKYSEALDETKVKKYCENVVLDAVLSSYIGKAERKGIAVTVSVRFPDELPVSDAELATVFANAIENAINACGKLEPEKRYIDIKVINHPKFMLQIANSFDGVAEFDGGVPVSREEGHGFGTRSIVAFCNKHGSYYKFEAKDERFVLQIDF